MWIAEINVIIIILARAVIIIAVITRRVTKMQINDEMFVREMTILHYFRLL
jgi:hypothetical protein